MAFGVNRYKLPLLLADLERLDIACVVFHTASEQECSLPVPVALDGVIADVECVPHGFRIIRVNFEDELYENLPSEAASPATNGYGTSRPHHN